MGQANMERSLSTEPENSWTAAERRRTVRIKRSSLLKAKLDGIDRPAIKVAEERDEFAQAFHLVYREYLNSGYIPEPKPAEMLYTVYHLLPETTVFIAKSYVTVVSTLTQIFDSRLFGLPMDLLYRRELDGLREKDRKIAEITALATDRSFRWRNLFLYLCKAMFWYAKYNDVNDLCITINPKHVRFYKTLFLFEQFGPERHYPRVNAPAVPMRLNMDELDVKAKQVYGSLDFECNLYDYFYRMRNNRESDEALFQKDNMLALPSRKRLMDKETTEYFIKAAPEIFNGLPPACKTYLASL